VTYDDRNGTPSPARRLFEHVPVKFSDGNRYVSRPPVATERLALSVSGQARLL